MGFVKILHNTEMILFSQRLLCERLFNCKDYVAMTLMQKYAFPFPCDWINIVFIFIFILVRIEVW